MCHVVGRPTVSGMTLLQRTGEGFLAALAARDFARLRGSFAEDIRFRLLVPRGAQANDGADETVGRFVGWFGGADELRLESSHVGTVGDRLVVTYRLRVRDADRWRLLEQHLVVSARPDGRFATVDLLCTGFHAAG